MFKQLTEHVYFGNWEAPRELAGKVRSVINVAHSFSRRKGRNKYWADLESVPWEVFYVRLAKKDRQDCDQKYFAAFAYSVRIAESLGKLPLLCHCQMGGHRGPTSAIAAAFILGGCKAGSLEPIHARMIALQPGLLRGHNYYHSMMRLCRENSQ